MFQRVGGDPVRNGNRTLYAVVLLLVANQVLLRLGKKHLKRGGILRIDVGSGKARLLRVLFVCAFNKIRGKLDAGQVADHIVRNIAGVGAARVAGQLFHDGVAVDDVYGVS